MNRWRWVKRGLLRSGLPPCRRLDFLNALLAYGQWIRRHPPPRHFPERQDLYRHVAEQLGGRPFDFLEAGVYRGESLRCWTQLSDCPETRFFGFDTFTGLPEAWHTGLKSFPAGQFDVGGVVPDIPDPRVRFYKGRFQQTVPEFLRAYRPQPQLVVHCDADLYSSTLYFLTRLHDVLAAGTYLLFDNFSVALHDFRAFCDYTGAYGRDYEVVATAEIDFEKIALRLK